ncbi:MAG: UDP-4-amino-4,6-dideoxy-N-acetyl-beta-L-altrosamine transaminase [Planctomycetes bacterium]|nr:UDP-4-amino-4,6-dideoxy-N-acetyl-beta-L-altrosamine transaminase [Planctomycetota bacterium]
MSNAIEIIPYGRHQLDQDDIDAVVDVLRNGWLTQGAKVTEFENAIASYCGAQYAVACNSGTAALHLAMLAAGIGKGDEIVAPAITFLATSNSGAYVGATPLFTDVDVSTVQMTAELLEPVLSENTRAVLPVHFAGYPCDMSQIAPLVRKKCPDAVIIEDACHALGAKHADGTTVGSLKWADMTMFSFHPVKHIATGEGGMILTDRKDLAYRLRLFRNHGMTKDASLLTKPKEGPWYYEMKDLGYNYRIPDINCALGLSQFKKIDGFVARRQAIAARYHKELANLPHVVIPSPENELGSSWHIYCLQIDYQSLGKSRKQVMKELMAKGVGTQVHYYPVPLQPWYRENYGYKEGDFAGAEKYYSQALTIPLFPAMTDEEVKRVIDNVFDVIKRIV